MSKDNHPSTSYWERTAVWGVEAAEQLVLAVHGAGQGCPQHFFRPREDERPQRLSKWRDLMGELADNVSFAFTHRDVLPELTYPGLASARAKDLATLCGRVVRLKSGLEKLSRHKKSEGGLLERIDQKLPSNYPGVIAIVEELLKAVKALQAEVGDRPPVAGMDTTAQGALIASLAKVYSQFIEKSPSEGLVREFGNFHGPFPAFVLKAYELSRDPKSSSTVTVALQRHFQG